MAARNVTRMYDDVLRPTGLRATQLPVLVAIAQDESLSITSVAKLLAMDRTTLTRNLRPLETEGLVKVGVEGWRRSRTIQITDSGRVRLQEALPYWQKAQALLKQKLGVTHLDVILDKLEQLINIG